MNGLNLPIDPLGQYFTLILFSEVKLSGILIYELVSNMASLGTIAINSFKRLVGSLSPSPKTQFVYTLASSSSAAKEILSFFLLSSHPKCKQPLGLDDLLSL